MKKYTAAILAILLVMATLPALASPTGAAPEDIALWQSQAPAPQGEFQKIITVLGDQSTPTIHRRLASSQRGAIIDDTPRFLPIRMTAAELWATLDPGDYQYMFDLNTDPNGMYKIIFEANRTSAIWAGNRIFEMLELNGGIYLLCDYKPADDTIDLSDRQGIYTPFDTVIFLLETQGYSTWTRIY